MTRRQLWRLGAVVIANAACESAPPPPASVDALIAPGESLYARGEYDSAARVWNAALQQPAVTGSLREARLLHWLGLSAYRRGEYQEARRLGDQALERKRGLGASRAEIAETQNALGLLAWSEGELHRAVTLLRDALHGFEADRDRAGIAKASNNLALVALELGRFEEARERFEMARTTAAAIGNARTEGRATTNLAMIEIWSGDPSKAPRLLRTARQLADSVNDPVGLENAVGQLAVAWSALGEPGRALVTLDTAIALAREHGLREQEAHDLLVAGTMYAEAGEPERAIELFRQARLINEELELDVETGMVLRHEAVVRAARGAYEHARADAERALRLHRAADAQLEEFEDLLTLGSIESLEGDFKTAAVRSAEARRLAAQLDAPQARVALALAEARIADRRGTAEQTLLALRGVDRDLPFASVTASVETEWLRTRAYASAGKLDSAVAAGRRAVGAIERTRSTIAAPSLRASFTVERSRVFADLALSLLRLGQTEEAFSVADAARGRALIEHLAGAREAVRRAPTTRDLAERERLQREIDALVSRLEEVQSRPRDERGADDENTSRTLVEQLNRKRTDFEAVLGRLAQREAERTALIGVRSASVPAIRAALAPDEALLEYLVTPERLIIFALTRGRVTPIEVAVPIAQLENRVRVARAIIGPRNRANSDAAVLGELHRLLIDPVLRANALGSARRLVIVPHGALAYLPFAALQNAAGKRLVEDYSIQYLSTAAALPALRRSSSGSGQQRVTVLAPFPKRLPATSTEAEVVARWRPGSRRVMGAAATERALRNALSTGHIVHVATHGVMNPANPLFSSLQLERRVADDAEDDGRLEVHELLGITTRSPLVFLSGCETGLGPARATPFDRSEDYATLGQALLFAGARSVVATLWRIDDEGAARFAERFYHHLTTRTAVDALAGAQRDLMRDVRWQHPYYWAGYTISGDGADLNSANRLRPSVSQ